VSSKTKDKYVSNIKQKLIIMTTARQQQLQQRVQQPAQQPAPSLSAIRALLQAAQGTEQYPISRGAPSPSSRSSSPASVHTPESVSTTLPLRKPLHAPWWSEQIRLRVYERKTNDWLDKGTGICHGVIDSKEDVFIVVTGETREHLLQMEVSKDDRYEKQRDTLILWTDKAGNVMALSFEKPEKCAKIWDLVTEAQRRLQDGVPLR
jgi:hypothetical protein